MLSLRRLRHQRISALLTGRNDDELASALRAVPTSAVGAGSGCSVLEVDGVPVFAKRIPITDRELAQPHSTANLFALPNYCHYGVYRLPGAGFGVWRELAANMLITQEVLSGESESFALLYHWRVLPGRAPVPSHQRDIETVLAQFDGNPAVRVGLEERAAARSSLVLFLEYVPHALLDTLTDPISQAETLERQLFRMAAFLRSRELLHMDGHFGNIRADDERIYLVDFGMALSPRFDLEDSERDFVSEHANHDAQYAAMRLVNWLVTTVCGIPLPASGGPVARNMYVRRCASGDIPRDVPAPVAEILARHAAAAERMNDFVWRLNDGELDAKYPGP